VFNKDGKEVEDESASKRTRESMSAVRESKREANKLIKPGCMSELSEAGASAVAWFQ
jgi:hypothetical protein